MPIEYAWVFTANNDTTTATQNKTSANNVSNEIIIILPFSSHCPTGSNVPILFWGLAGLAMNNVKNNEKHWINNQIQGPVLLWGFCKTVSQWKLSFH